MKKAIAVTVSCFGAGAGAAAMHLALHFAWPQTLALSLATFGGLVYFLSGEKKPEAAPELTPELLSKHAAEVIDGLKRLNHAYPKTRMAGHIDDMAATVRRIADRVRDDPKCAESVAFFLEHEARAVLPALARYVEFAGRPNKSPALETKLAEQEKMIPLIAAKMDEHYQKILHHELMDLEAGMGGLAGRLGIDAWDMDALEKEK